MKSNSIRTIRREELSRAAFEAVVLYGLRKATLEKIGKIAGVSKGVVLHHFKDKSSLLEAVFRRSNSLLSESVIELYRHTERQTDVQMDGFKKDRRISYIISIPKDY